MQNSGNDCILRYLYYEQVPTEVIMKLELQFVVTPEETPEDFTIHYTYVLSTKDSKADPKDYGASFKRFKQNLNEIVREVIIEVEFERNVKQLLKEQEEPKEGEPDVQIGKKYPVSWDFGKFKKGDTIEIVGAKFIGADVEILARNQEGVMDNFFIDPDDDSLSANPASHQSQSED